MSSPASAGALPGPVVRSVDTIEIGASASVCQRISADLVEAYANLSGDRNPLHMDEAFARTTGFRRRVVHGMIVASYVSQLIGMRLPGPGALWTEQSFRWLAPIFIDDTLTVTLTVIAKSAGAATVSVEVEAVNQDGRTVMQGNGKVQVVAQRKSTSDIPLCERNALVTGGSRGIGAAIALALAGAGAKVTIVYHENDADAERTCRDIEAAGGAAIAIRTDVRDAAGLQKAVESARERFGKHVDVLVNNAGCQFTPAPFTELTWDEVQRQLDVHVRGAFQACQAVLPGMLELNSGRIVNIGSTHMRAAPPAQWTAFSIAKAALKSMTRSLAVEFGPKGVLINMVSPGLVETDFTAGVPERTRKVQAMQTPLRRLATVDDIAAAVVYLCSEHSGFATGVDLPVCGGNVM